MIDDKKLIDKLRDWIRTDYFEDWSARNFILNDIIAEINKMPKVGEWIPVSERPPEDLTPVNITWVNRKPVSYYMHIKDKPFTATGILCHGAWYWFSARCEDYLKEYGDSKVDAMDEHIEVIAWQPLPEPYREESVE